MCWWVSSKIMNIKGLILTRQPSWSTAKSAWTAFSMSYYNSEQTVPCWLQSVGKGYFKVLPLLLPLKKTGYWQFPANVIYDSLAQILACSLQCSKLEQQLSYKQNGETVTCGVTCSVKLSQTAGWMKRCCSVINLQPVELSIPALCSPRETFGMTPVWIFYIRMLFSLYCTKEHPLKGGKVI